MLLSTILHTWCILFCIPITSLKAMFCAQCQPSIGQLSSVRHNTSDQPLQMMTEKKSNPRNPFFKNTIWTIPNYLCSRPPGDLELLVKKLHQDENDQKRKLSNSAGFASVPQYFPPFSLSSADNWW